MAITYHAGRRIQGLSTDIAQTATYETETFATGWEQNTTGTTNIAVANSRVEYDVTDSGTSQSTLVYDLGTANISETSWTLRGKCVINNYSSTSGSSCHFFCGLSNGSKTVYFDGSQNSISFAIGVGTADTAYYLGSSVNGAMYAMTSQTSGNITHLPTAETVWFEIKRNNATSATITLYTDSTYTTSPAGYSRTLTLSSAPTGLRYLVFKSRDRSIAGNSLDGYVDDLEFYNGTTSSKPTNVQVGSRYEETDTRKMYHYEDGATVSDDFSSTSGWTQNDSAKIGLDTSNDKLDFNIVLVGNDNAYRAITTGSTTWVMRYLLRFSTISTSSGSNIYFVVDISDDGTTAGNNYATGSIGLRMNVDDSTNNSLDLFGNGATLDEIFVPVVNTDYYVEVIKTSATTATATVGTDSYGGTTNGGSGSITGLTASTAQDTFAVRNRGTSSGSSGHSIIGYIKNFQYYNGVTSAGNVWVEEGT